MKFTLVLPSGSTFAESRSTINIMKALV